MPRRARPSIALLATHGAAASVLYGMYDLFNSAGRDWPPMIGLPPGELINKTKACEPESSSALRMEAMTFSALPSPSEPISPLIETMAVCGMLGLMAGEL